MVSCSSGLCLERCCVSITAQPMSGRQRVCDTVWLLTANRATVQRHMTHDFLLVCRTSDLLGQIETGKASASPCWLSWWCSRSSDSQLFCCQKVTFSTDQWRKLTGKMSIIIIMNQKTASCLFYSGLTVLHVMVLFFPVDDGGKHAGSQLTLDDLFHRNFQIHDPNAKWISGEFFTELTFLPAVCSGWCCLTAVLWCVFALCCLIDWTTVSSWRWHRAAEMSVDFPLTHSSAPSEQAVMWLKDFKWDTHPNT